MEEERENEQETFPSVKTRNYHPMRVYFIMGYREACIWSLEDRTTLEANS